MLSTKLFVIIAAMAAAVVAAPVDSDMAKRDPCQDACNKAYDECLNTWPSTLFFQNLCAEQAAQCNKRCVRGSGGAVLAARSEDIVVKRDPCQDACDAAYEVCAKIESSFFGSCADQAAQCHKECVEDRDGTVLAARSDDDLQVAERDPCQDECNKALDQCGLTYPQALWSLCFEQAAQCNKRCVEAGGGAVIAVRSGDDQAKRSEDDIIVKRDPCQDACNKAFDQCGKTYPPAFWSLCHEQAAQCNKRYVEAGGGALIATRDNDDVTKDGECEDVCNRGYDKCMTMFMLWDSICCFERDRCMENCSKRAA